MDDNTTPNEKDHVTSDDDASEEVTSDASSSSPLPPPRKILPSRVTRGRRMGRLVGEIAEADEMFWNQDAFREDDSDESIAESDINSESSDGSDSADSDIDKSEPDEDDDEEGGRGKESGGKRGGGGGGGKNKSGAASSGGGVFATAWDDEGGKKKGRYVDPALKGKRGRGGGGGGGSTASGGVNFEQLAVKAKASLETGHCNEDIVEKSRDQRVLGGKRKKANEGGTSQMDSLNGKTTTTPLLSSNPARLSVRASTQVMTEQVKQKEIKFEHQKKQQLLNKQELLKRSREEGDDSEDARDSLPTKKLSQSESLIQAAKTTVENLLSLEALLSEKRDDEASGGGGGRGGLSGNGSSKVKGFPIGTPLLRFLSKRGQADTLTFTEVDDFPRSIKNLSDHSVILAKCAVTGKTANYRDPLSGKPYSDVEAFKLIKMKRQ